MDVSHTGVKKTWRFCSSRKVFDISKYLKGGIQVNNTDIRSLLSNRKIQIMINRAWSKKLVREVPDVGH